MIVFQAREKSLKMRMAEFIPYSQHSQSVWLTVVSCQSAEFRKFMNSFDSLSLTPMSAGDIIDRAVRLYRRNFLSLLRIVLGPSLVAYLGTVLYYVGLRNFSLERGNSRVVISVILIISGFTIWILGKAAFYAVLGGASRSLVDHFFEGKPILARDAYRAVRERFWSLLGALFMIALLLMGAGAIIYFLVAIMALVGIFAAPLFSGTPYWLQTVLSVGFGTLIALIVLMVILLLYSRVVYVPQVMMVEGKGVFNSISRSFTLAGKEMWRITALLLFWIYVAWSAWWLLYIPLGSVAYWLGVDPNPFNQDMPLWFSITYQTLTQVSEILIAPIAMLGFTLLYLDSRVRKEGFDVELLANRLMPPTPQMMARQMTPQPLFFTSPIITQPSGSIVPSILGLNDYMPVHQPMIEPLPSPPIEVQLNAEEEGLADPVAPLLAPAEPQAFSPEVGPLREPEKLSSENEPVASTIEAFQRACRWCGTDASGDDRFCRVCGSVF